MYFFQVNSILYTGRRYFQNNILKASNQSLRNSTPMMDKQDSSLPRGMILATWLVLARWMTRQYQCTQKIKIDVVKMLMVQPNGHFTFFKCWVNICSLISLPAHWFSLFHLLNEKVNCYSPYLYYSSKMWVFSCTS